VTHVEPLYEELGARIRLARIVRGLTQAELGAALQPKQTRAGIANIESAKQRVLVHTLVQIVAALGVSFEEILPPVKAHGRRK
jgi:transcriptional regulator with XRE-family HTH domain